MRAFGIPVTIDFTPKWPDSNVGHTWNSVRDSSGLHISFVGSETNPYMPHQGSDIPKGKVYRRTFAKQKEMINLNRNNMPTELQNPYMQDVSQEYDRFVDVEIPICYPTTDNSGYAYLATMGGSLNWNLIAWGQVEQQKIHFSSIGKNMLYLPVYYENKHRKPAGYPFRLNLDGVVRILEPDTTRYEKLNLSTTEQAMKRLENTQNQQEQNRSEKQVYELFCWMDRTWHFLEKQEAKNQLLQFYIPSNALFYLKNNATGKVTKVFIVQNGVVRWL